MYVVTFYSFKGGVGRSMALMNTAAALVAGGRKVLVVDFDLEAPGLDTFDFPKPKSETKGVVEFVTDYANTNKAPPVEDYLYQSSVEDSSSGELWIMPAGARNSEYANRLNAINWRQLYREKNGYLLIEDLKAQWESFLKPDYVLIDSRTGHTDVGGICTRQLPNAVVCLFFPNEQNLVGLVPVVDRIRNENKERESHIALHFVTSNVPDLDDEYSILEETLSSFKSKLGYRKLASVIHHYPSLALLNQDIFTRDRPNSRLATEYLQLVELIQKDNAEDRDGVLAFLKDLVGLDSASRSKRAELLFDDKQEARIDRILEIHGTDVEVLLAVVRLREREGRLEEVDALLARALEKEPANPELLVRKAITSDRLRQPESAVHYALTAAREATLEGFELNRVVRILATNSPESLKEIDTWPSVVNLEEGELLVLTRSLSFDRALLSEAERLYRAAIERSNTASSRTDLSLILIGLGRFEEARKICEELLIDDEANMATNFNLAMATWGETCEVPVNQFRVVSGIDPEITKYSSPNYLQCMSLAYWAIGELDKAREVLNKAERSMNSSPDISFSCWSYLYRRPAQFREDLRLQKRMYSGEDVQPEFIGIGRV